MDREFQLVYQAGIANIFEVQSLNLKDFGRDAKRILQSDFETCESFARGLAFLGATVASCYCNEAGDITHSNWHFELDDAPFCNKFRPVFNGVARYEWISFERHDNEG